MYRDFVAGSSIALACVLLGGCNPYHTPISLRVDNEILHGKRTVAVSRGTILVPDGWAVRGASDAKEPLESWATLEKVDSRGRVAVLDVSIVSEKPEWINASTPDRTSTVRYPNVLYKVLSAEPPSGDDTPANYTVSAIVTSKDSDWLVSVRFFVPVKPNLQEAVKYVDIVNHEGNKPDR
jgi:hypothetical protein